MKINQLGIHIKVANFKKSKAFYEALRFQKIFEYGPDKKTKEDYNGITFQVGTTKLEIADGHRAVKPEVFREPIRSSKVSLMVNVDRISAVLNLCKQRNIPIAVGPRHYYWGTLEVVVKDPDGLVLVFIAPYSKKESKLVKADETFGKPPSK